MKKANTRGKFKAVFKVVIKGETENNKHSPTTMGTILEWVIRKAIKEHDAKFKVARCETLELEDELVERSCPECNAIIGYDDECECGWKLPREEFREYKGGGKHFGESCDEFCLEL